jgi:hypothetical protein
VQLAKPFLYLNANLKFPICQHKMQVTPINLSKFISNPKIPNANQMLISFFPHITQLCNNEDISYKTVKTI